MANNTVVISRIQHRRGLKENLPQPLLPGELALTVDTGELWIGNNLNQPPFGIRTYSEGFSSTAETIVDTQIASAKFTLQLTEPDFEGLVTYLTGAPTPAVVLTEDDILWDGVSAVFIAADITVDPNNTVINVLDAVSNWVNATTFGYDPENSNALGVINQPWIGNSAGTLQFVDSNPDTIVRDAGSWITDGFYVGQRIYVSGSVSNDGTYTVANVAALTLTLDPGDSLVAEGPTSTGTITLRGARDPLIANAFDIDGVFQFTATFATPNAQQGANAAILINALNGAGLVTTFGNLQIPTSGIGVGALTFRDFIVDNTDVGFTWQLTGQASADTGTDQLTLVAGTNIELAVDPTLDAIRISNLEEQDPDKLFDSFQAGVTEFTLAANTVAFTNVTNFAFDLDTESDVIFVEYSGNIDGATASADNYTVMGKMEIVASNLTDAGLASLNDDQNEVRDGALVGDIAFQATYVAGSPNRVQVQYTNTFTKNVVIRTLRRRWMSF